MSKTSIPNELIQEVATTVNDTPKETKKSCTKRLTLIDARISHDMMEKYLCDFVNLSEHLEELNISDNKLLSKSFIKLIYSLATNSRLRYLNLSWNSIIDDKK